MKPVAGLRIRQLGWHQDNQFFLRIGANDGMVTFPDVDQTVFGIASEMKLLDDIIDLASSEQGSVTTLLRKCLVLAHTLKNDRLRSGPRRN